MHSTLADLHAYADQGLPSSQRAAVKAHLSTCADCRQKLADVEHQRALVSHELTALLPATASVPSAAQQLEKLRARRAGHAAPSRQPAAQGSSWWDNPKWQIWSMWAAPLVAACFLVVMWVDRQMLTPTPPTPSPSVPLAATAKKKATAKKPAPVRPRKPFLDLRAKGANLELQMLYAPETKHKHPEAVSSGARLQPGGLIQFRFALKASQHVMVVGINHAGIVFPYYPFRGTQSTKLGPGPTARPEGSALELDDTLGPERFVLLSAKKAFSFKTAARTLHTWWLTQGKDVRRPLQLPAPWVTGSVLIEKHNPSPRRAIVKPR